MVSREVAAIDRILAHEFTNTEADDGSVVDRNYDIENIRSGKLTFDKMDLHEMEVRDYGNFAVVIVRITTTGKWEGKPFSANHRYTDVFVRRAGRWQCIAGAGAPVKP